MLLSKYRAYCKHLDKEIFQLLKKIRFIKTSQIGLYTNHFILVLQ